jgi:D-alanyl-D-alanine carboxypeptidase
VPLNSTNKIKFSVSVFAILLIASSFSRLLYSQPKPDCDEKIIIDGREYPVSKRWCGKKLEQKDLADSKTLSKLPSELTFENYKIYVTPETKTALTKMSEAANKDGIKLKVDSGFRSVWYQKQIYQRRLERGEKIEKIISFVAPPGYSEHHTGRAVDFVPSEARFAHTKTYQWLKANAAKYGFHETYTEDSTGKIPWESWHWVFIPK